MPSTEWATSTALGDAVGDERLDGGPPDVGVEPVGRRRDLDHLVDARQRRGVGERARRPGQHGHRHGSRAQRDRGADHLRGDVAQRTLAMLGDHEDTHDRCSPTSSTMRAATSAARPGSISAPSPCGGSAMRQPVAPGASSPERTSISVASACLIWRKLT